MAFVTDVTALDSYASIHKQTDKTKCVTSVNSLSSPIMITPSSELALVERYRPVPFSTISKLKNIIAARFKRLSGVGAIMNMNISSSNIHVFMNIIHIHYIYISPIL
jgi:hypothetical protein